MITRITDAFCDHAPTFGGYQIIKFGVFRITFRAEYFTHEWKSP